MYEKKRDKNSSVIKILSTSRIHILEYFLAKRKVSYLSDVYEGTILKFFSIAENQRGGYASFQKVMCNYAGT